MSGARVRIDGQARMARTSGVAARAMGVGFDQTTAEVAARGAVLARGRAPRRSGALASTIAADASTFGVASSYGPAQEYGVGPRRGLRGGHNIRAKRYLRGAAEAVRPYAVAAVTRRARRIMRTVKGA